MIRVVAIGLVVAIAIIVPIMIWHNRTVEFEIKHADKLYLVLTGDIEHDEKIKLFREVASSDSKTASIADLHLAALYINMAQKNDKKKQEYLQEAIKIYNKLITKPGLNEVFYDYAKIAKSYTLNSNDEIDNKIFYSAGLLLKALNKLENGDIDGAKPIIEMIHNNPSASERTRIIVKDFLEVYKYE